jgi:AcrR family transcriptional regulator
MAKSFSDSERAYIKQKLLTEAKICLSKYGVRKTTVDELVKRVNIPKGTFYLFYDSKELLFFDVFNGYHDEIHDQLMTEIANRKGAITPEWFTSLILSLYNAVEDSFLLQFMTNGEMELLIRKLPPDLAATHTLEDDLSVEKLLSLIPGMVSSDAKAFSGALRAIFLSMLHKHEIGEDVFKDALRILINGVVLQMFKGESK